MWPSAPARNEPIGASTIRLRSSMLPMRPGESRWRYSSALMRRGLAQGRSPRGGSRGGPGARAPPHSRHHHLEHGDLAGDAEPQREAVEAGAAVHVEPARAAGEEAVIRPAGAREDGP